MGGDVFNGAAIIDDHLHEFVDHIGRGPHRPIAQRARIAREGQRVIAVADHPGCDRTVLN